MPELKIDQNQKTIELPKYNQHVLDGVLQRIEREKEHIKRLLVQIFYKIQNADHIIFVARQIAIKMHQIGTEASTGSIQ